MQAQHGAVAIAAALALSSLALPVTAPASDNKGQYTIIIEPGADSCGRFVAARSMAVHGNFSAEAEYSMWLAGYLTAFNRLDPGTNDISANRDMFSILGWLETYCKNNSASTFTQAVAALTAELYPDRSTKGPDRAT